MEDQHLSLKQGSSNRGIANISTHPDTTISTDFQQTALSQVNNKQTVRASSVLPPVPAVVGQDGDQLEDQSEGNWQVRLGFYSFREAGLL